MRQIKNKIIAKLFTKYPALVNWWAQNSEFVEFSESPWTQLTKDASQCCLSLVTTSGVHLKSQPAFNMKDPAGDPTFREIPADTFHEDLTITHNYYDHSDADKDINIVFPTDLVHDLKQTGAIGSVNHRHFSFMGHITEHHIYTLMRDTGPMVASALKADGVDIAILTPA